MSVAMYSETIIKAVMTCCNTNSWVINSVKSGRTLTKRRPNNGFEIVIVVSVMYPVFST